MSFKLLTISSMYAGYLEAFYKRFTGTKYLSYDDHYNLLLNDTTEFAGSYTRTFRKLGIDAKCIIANDNYLQKKWQLENGIKSNKSRDILIDQVARFKPDILWIENLSYTDSEWLQSVRKNIKSIRLIIAYHCSPYSSGIFERMHWTDFVITCTPGLKMDMESKGLRTYLVYHGFDQELLDRIDKGNPFEQKKFIFSGSLTSGGDFHGNRIALIENILKENIDLDLYVNLEKKYKIRAKQSIYFISELLSRLNLEKVKDHFPLLKYGRTPVKRYSETLLKKKHPPVFGMEMYKLFYNSNVVLNYHIGVAGDYAGNMRLFEVTGLGSCLVTDNKKNMSELFDLNSEVVVYDGVEDCISKVKWLLENEEARKKIALSGHQKTIKSHTVEARCKSIIEIINGELKKK